MRKATLLPIQYLRALAALMVFYYHFTASLVSGQMLDESEVFRAGAAGVDLFFVISGFIMAKIAWDASDDAPLKPWNFMRQRVARIVPLYWAATLVVFGVALFLPSLLGSTKADWLQLLHSLLFIPYGVNGEISVPTLLVGWTLNYEMFFYCIVALFAGVFGDRRLLFASVLIALLAVCGWIFDPQNGYLKVYTQPVILEFAMGIAVFHIWRNGDFEPSGAGRSDMMPLMMHVMFWLSILAIFLLQSFDAGDWRPLFWGLPGATLLLSSLQVIRFKSALLKKMGDWSYSIYILHLFVIMAFVKVLLPRLGEWTPAHVVSAGLLCLVLIPASMLTYRFFEVPVKNWLAGKPSGA